MKTMVYVKGAVRSVWTGMEMRYATGMIADSSGAEVAADSGRTWRFAELRYPI